MVRIKMRENRESWRNIFILIELPEVLRTPRENKRVKSFLEGKAKIEALCTNNCRVCGKKIVAPSDFCGSECRRKFNVQPKKSSPINVEENISHEQKTLVSE